MREVMLARVRSVQKMKRGVEGTTFRRSLSAARSSSYFCAGVLGGGRGDSVGGRGSKGGGGGSSESGMCWQRVQGVVPVVRTAAAGVGFGVGGLLRT